MFMYGVDNENDLFYLILFLNITVTASSKLSCAFFLLYLDHVSILFANRKKKKTEIIQGSLPNHRTRSL